MYVWLWSIFQYSGANNVKGHVEEQSECSQFCHKKTYKSPHSPSWFVVPPSQGPISDNNATSMVSGFDAKQRTQHQRVRVVEIQAGWLRTARLDHASLQLGPPDASQARTHPPHSWPTYRISCAGSGSTSMLSPKNTGSSLDLISRVGGFWKREVA